MAVDAIRRRLQVPCPTKYGSKEAANDCARLMQFTALRDNQTALTEAQKAEEAHLRAALEDAERLFIKSRLTGDFPATPLARKERDELELLRWLYPKPKRNLSQLDGDDGLEMYCDHPFQDAFLAPDGNFYPRHSKLRPAGAADDLLVQTGDGSPISPVIPCNAPATDPSQSVEPPKRYVDAERGTARAAAEGITSCE